MAEAFHHWVASLSPWERLFYEIFFPDALSCSTRAPTFSLGTVLLILVPVFVIWILLWRYGRKADKIGAVWEDPSIFNPENYREGDDPL